MKSPHDVDAFSRPMDTETFAAICKALAHPVRIRIVKHLRRLDTCICGEIVDNFPLAQSTVSQHLKILKQSGLIVGTVDGPRSCYCIDKNMLAAFKKTAEQL